MMCFDKLPEYPLYKTIRYLDRKSLGEIQGTCKKVHEIVHKNRHRLLVNAVKNYSLVVIERKVQRNQSTHAPFAFSIMKVRLERDGHPPQLFYYDPDWEFGFKKTGNGRIEAYRFRECSFVQWLSYKLYNASIESLALELVNIDDSDMTKMLEILKKSNHKIGGMAMVDCSFGTRSVLNNLRFLELLKPSRLHVYDPDDVYKYPVVREKIHAILSRSDVYICDNCDANFSRPFPLVNDFIEFFRRRQRNTVQKICLKWLKTQLEAWQGNKLNFPQVSWILDVIQPIRTTKELGIFFGMPHEADDEGLAIFRNDGMQCVFEPKREDRFPFANFWSLVSYGSVRATRI